MCCCCDSNRRDDRGSRRGGMLGSLLAIVLLYLGLVFGGGTLINTGHPVAVEAGRLIHVVTFVEPAISWADRAGLDPLAHGLRMLAHGADLGRIA